MLTNKIFEFYAKYFWPILRVFIKKTKRCSRCILSEKYSPLQNGLCRECIQLNINLAEDINQISESEIKRFNETIKSYISNKPYHALLLLSGGKDSAYILNKIRIDFPQLNILCVIVNNGFMSPVAIGNANYLAAKLKTDLLIVNNKINEFSKILRQAFLSLNGKGSYGIVDHADGTFIFNIGKKIAKDMNIPLMISGLSWVQVQRIVGMNDFEIKPDNEVHEIFPLAVWRTNEQEIRSIVRTNNLLLPGSDSPIVSNSSLILTMAVVDVLNLGYSSFEPEFAQLIREGKTDRKVWLHSFELLEFGTRFGFLQKAAEESLNQLQLSLKDIIKENL